MGELRQKLFTKKPIDVLLAQASEEGANSLRRGLGAFSVTAIGIGAIIGAGIFVLTGQQAAINAGPGIVLSFILAGVVCTFAALCYAELASMIPVSGSAYTYTYATLGEFIAWIVAWDLILEYGLAASTVSAGWSGHFRDLLEGFGLTLPYEWSHAPFSFHNEKFDVTGAYLNLPAMVIVTLMASALIAGIAHSAVVNNVIVGLKLTIVAMVIAFGLAYVDPSLWHPLIPQQIPATATEPSHFGYQGIVAAAGVIFFAYIGFEAVSTAAQETRNPQRNMPIGILSALAICTVLYILMALVITGLAPYATLNNDAPVARALANIPDLYWLRQVVNLGVAVGLGSTILSLLYGQSRVFYAMSRDGLLPPLFAKVNPKTRTPVWGTAITAGAAALVGGLFPIDVLGKLVSMGTLLAFALICGGVFYLRLKHPEIPRVFKTPLWWLTAPFGVLGCLYLVSGLPPETWLRLIVWMVIGLVVYATYAYHHSRYHEKKMAAGSKPATSAAE